MSVGWKHSLACAIHDGAPCSCKEDAAGPLAQQFAHLHGVFSYARSTDLAAGGISDGEYNEAVGALSAIERHVQDMEKALTEQHSKLWLVGLDTHEGEPPQSREYSHKQLDRLLDEAALLARLDQLGKESDA